MSLRNTAPAIHPLQKINFVEPHIFDITPTVKLYWMQPVPDDTTRIEFHFDAGTIRGNRKIAGFVNSLLLSGTADKTSTQINQELAQPKPRKKRFKLFRKPINPESIQD
jgi:hypothetical protein